MRWDKQMELSYYTTDRWYYYSSLLHIVMNFFKYNNSKCFVWWLDWQKVFIFHTIWKIIPSRTNLMIKWLTLDSHMNWSQKNIVCLSSFNGMYMNELVSSCWVIYSCAWKFGRPCAAATLLAISPDVYNVASCQLLLR